ncbi:hypothetical protein, partial [Verticiella sediminum]|uniref:hypothetical protein n=1 Tax=Verticiella sediminum TaxID=1247510 RepID=UPI0031E7F33F
SAPVPHKCGGWHAVVFFVAGPPQGKKRPLGGSQPKAQRGGLFRGLDGRPVRLTPREPHACRHAALHFIALQHFSKSEIYWRFVIAVTAT